MSPALRALEVLLLLTVGLFLDVNGLRRAPAHNGLAGKLRMDLLA